MSAGLNNRNAAYYKALSKTLAHALRHAPWIYELELDEVGWTDVEAVLDGLSARRKWADVTIDDITHVIEHQTKERYQLEGVRIRALYGHSLQAKILKEPAMPPEILFYDFQHQRPCPYQPTNEHIGGASVSDLVQE